MSRLLGDVPYLNGGIFQKHQIEAHHGESIQIPDAAFDGSLRSLSATNGTLTTVN